MDVKKIIIMCFICLSGITIGWAITYSISYGIIRDTDREFREFRDGYTELEQLYIGVRDTKDKLIANNRAREELDRRAIKELNIIGKSISSIQIKTGDMVSKIQGIIRTLQDVKVRVKYLEDYYNQLNSGSSSGDISGGSTE